MANEDKATRYHRLRRRTAALSRLTAAGILLIFVVSGAAVLLRDDVESWTNGSGPWAIAVYAMAVLLVIELAALPFAFHSGVTLEHRYGLSTQTAGRWWIDRIKSVALGAVLAVAAAVIVVYLRRWLPAYWWLAAAGIFTVLLVALARLAPVLLMPLFEELKPLDRPELAARLVALARRANAEVVGVFEWGLGARTRKANAALTGLGRTRRILLSDTLLADHSDDEVEVILAHELSHHVHQDIWTSLALEAALITAGFYASAGALAWWEGWAMGGEPLDIAALPVVALVAGAVSLCMAPVSHALSRAHERRADRFALEMTGNADAFVSAMRRLAATNMAEERPSKAVVWLFHSHPTASARIAAASAWSETRGAQIRREVSAAAR